MGDPFLLILLLVMLGGFMWFASRQRKKAMKATIDLHESLQIGDRVHTTSGMEATITGITDDSVDLELAIRDRILPDADLDDDEEFEDDDDETAVIETAEVAENDTPGDPDRLRKD